MRFPCRCYRSFLCMCLVLIALLIIDTCISTSLLVMHNYREILLYNQSLFNRYDIGSSCVDLWLISLIKITLFTIILVIILFSKKGFFGLVKLKYFIYGYVLLENVFVFGKLLISFEFYQDGLPIHYNSTNNGQRLQTDYNNSSVLHWWLWSLLAWNVITDISYFMWFFFIINFKKSQVGFKFRKRMRRNLTANLSDTLIDNSMLNSVSETDPLIKEIVDKNENECDSDDDDDDNKDKGTFIGKTKGMLLLLSFCKQDVHLLIMGFICMTVGAVANTFIPFYLGYVINTIIYGNSLKPLLFSLAIMGGIDVISAIFQGLRGGIFTVSVAKISIRIRSKLYERIVAQEIGFFDKNLTGDITSRLTSDTQLMSDQITMNINIFLRSLIQIFGSFIFMFILSWKLTIATIVSLPFLFYFYEMFGDVFKRLAKSIQDSLAEANNVAEETISSMRTVRSFANELNEAARYRSKLRIVYKYQIQEALVYGGFLIISKLIENASVILSLLYGGYLVMNHELTPGHLISYIFYWISLDECFQSIGEVFTGMMQAVGAAEKVFEIIRREPKINHNSGDHAPKKIEGMVEFKNVKFSYPTREDSLALNGLSFAIHPGQTVALVGPSGGGKSTCINLLERFYEPQEGQITLDGRYLNDYTHSNLHKQLALVSQEPVLFARSVKENIIYGLENDNNVSLFTSNSNNNNNSNDIIKIEDIEKVAKLSNAHEFINALPQKFETTTGEKGTQLSGGQKQRIAIARAIVREPSVLLLDEATSALDAESEALVQEALSRQMDSRSVLIIAHRLSTVENADKIIVIDKGRVVEEGSHLELLKCDGLYSKLVYRQLLAGEEGRKVCINQKSKIVEKSVNNDDNDDDSAKGTIIRKL